MAEQSFRSISNSYRDMIELSEEVIVFPNSFNLADLKHDEGILRESHTWELIDGATIEISGIFITEEEDIVVAANITKAGKQYEKAYTLNVWKKILHQGFLPEERN